MGDDGGLNGEVLEELASDPTEGGHCDLLHHGAECWVGLDGSIHFERPVRGLGGCPA